jgi:hypothetical protein
MNRGQEILIMTVSITDDKKDQIIVRENDNPEDLASNFIARYNLNPKLTSLLTEEILSNLSNLNLPFSHNPSSSKFHPTSINKSSTLSSMPKEYPHPDIYTQESYENNGQKLYAKGLRQNLQSENHKQALKIRLEQEQNKELTFQPKINPVSNILASRKIDRSIDSIRRKESEMAQFHVERQVKELSECTFTPKINLSSSKMIEYKQKPSSKRFEELYEDSLIRKHKQEYLRKHVEYSFKPEILSTKNVSSSGERLFCKKPFDELEYYRQSELKDPETGQEFFAPQINKGIYNRIREVPIGEHLYRQKKEPAQSCGVFNTEPSLESNRRSEQLLNRAKRMRYYEIFQQFNPDEQGMIHYENIEPRHIEPSVLKLMGQMLDVWGEEKEPLDFETFAGSLDNLLKILSPDERIVFLIYKRNKEDTQRESVKTSSFLAETDGVYSRQLEKKLTSQARIELEREKRYRSELDGCTFHPQTTPYKTFGKRNK